MKIDRYEDLNYQCSFEELYPGELGVIIGKSSFPSVLVKIAKLIYYSFRSLNLFEKRVEFPDGTETLIVICSLNQYRALSNLIQKLPNALVLSNFPIECKNNIVINTRGCGWVSLINLPLLIINILFQKGFKRKSMIFHFDDYLNTPGVYRNALKHIKKIMPKSLLVANDHVFFPRSYFRAAQKFGIKTIYTQHASVSSLFPPLEFSYVFLDGQETLDKYTSNRRKHFSDVFLSGSPRFDNIPLIPEVNTFDLGIAINMADNKDKVLNFVLMLIKNKINFMIRPHPGQTDIVFWEQFCKENNVGYSNPFEDSPIIFIASCKCFVVGDSAIHLEIALCKKVSYYMNFQNGRVSDGYEFIERGLIEIKTQAEIIDIITNAEIKNISVEKVKYYVSNFDTEFWGKSTDLIATTINEINKDKNLTKWECRFEQPKIFEIKE